MLAELDEWVNDLTGFLNAGVTRVIGLEPGSFSIEMRCYGANAILGDLEPRDGSPPREVLVMAVFTAADQATATAMAKYANPYLLHMPRPWMRDLPSFAFAFSPAETPRGPAYEFILQHVVELDDPLDLCRIEVGAA